MKDYKRLTRQSVDNFKYCLKDHKAKIGEFNDYDAFFDYSMAVKRLGELEDKIESGELCDRDEVRKETARTCIILAKQYQNSEEIVRDIAEKYSIDLRNEE